MNNEPTTPGSDSTVTRCRVCSRMVTGPGDKNHDGAAHDARVADMPTARPVADDGLREALGRHVREVWVAWANEQENPKASWLVPWEGLPERDREVDRRIGEALYLRGVADDGPRERENDARTTLDYLEGLSARSRDGRLRDAIALVRSAVRDDTEAGS